MSEFAGTDGSDPDGGGTGLRPLFVRGLVRSLPWMILLVVLGAAAGTVAGLVQPNRFVSNAKLFLRMGAREQLTSESLVDIEERQLAPPPTMVDELQMLADVAIFERVARELGPRVVLQAADPERNDGELTPWPVRLLHGLQGCLFRRQAERESDPAEDELRLATRLLREETVVLNEPRSSVIQISSTASTPELARTIVQALASAFIQRHREQYSIESLLEPSRTRLEQAKAARDEAAKAYVEQLSKGGIVVLETQVKLLETELGTLEAELFAARARREELSQVQTSLVNRPQGSPVQQNTGHSEAESRLVDAAVEDQALLVKIALLESRVEVKRGRLTELQRQLLGATMMRKDLAASRDAEELRYSHLLERYSALEGLENIHTEANLSVLQAPTLELEKVSPRRGGLLLKGLLLGLLAAFAFAILRQRLQRRLCDPESFEHARSVPVLGVVPHLKSLDQLGRRALRGGS